MTKLYIDLTRFNPRYVGGATRFTQGLADALPEALRLHRGHRPEPGSIVINPLCTIKFFDFSLRHILCIHDIQHEIYPENFSLVRRKWRKWQYRRSANAAWKIQVSSYAMWNDLTKYMAVPSEKIFLAPEGYDEKLWSPDLPDRKPEKAPNKKFVYYPAGMWVHKNHETVIRGLVNTGVSLVLSGQDYGEWPRIEVLAARSSVPLFYLRVIPEIEMRWLYKNAVATIAAGYYESGSLPLKEALACGGRVLAANISPNLELRGLDKLHFFETLSGESFRKQLKNILAGNAIGGWKSLEDYRWSEIAKIYRQIVNG